MPRRGPSRSPRRRRSPRAGRPSTWAGRTSPRDPSSPRRNGPAPTLLPPRRSSSAPARTDRSAARRAAGARRRRGARRRPARPASHRRPRAPRRIGRSFSASCGWRTEATAMQPGPRGLGPDQRGEGVARADLQEDAVGLRQQQLRGRRRSGPRRAGGGPVRRDRGLLGGDPGAGDVREVRDPRAARGATSPTPPGSGRGSASIIGEWKACEVWSAGHAHVPRGELALERVDRRAWAGDHAERRAVDGGERRGPSRSSGRISASAAGARRASPRPGIACMSRPRSRHEREGVLEERTPARQAATYSPRLWPIMAGGSMPQLIQQPGERVLDDEEGRLRDRGLPAAAPRPSPSSAAGRREEELAQVAARAARAALVAAVDLLAEDRLGTRRARGPCPAYWAPRPGNRKTDRPVARPRRRR